MPDLKRIERELRSCKNFNADGVKVECIGDSLVHLMGYFKGPDDTPYAGGLFKVDIKIPDDYPFKPPAMKFGIIQRKLNIKEHSDNDLSSKRILTDWNDMFGHPKRCLVTCTHFKDGCTVLFLSLLNFELISLQSLLFDPAPDDPQDAHVASIFLNDRQTFDLTAKNWTRMYAFPLDPQASVKRLCEEMGFELKQVQKALLQAEGDEAQAIEFILTGAV